MEARYRRDVADKHRQEEVGDPSTGLPDGRLTQEEMPPRLLLLVGATSACNSLRQSHAHFCERLDWVMPLGCNRLLTSLFTN